MEEQSLYPVILVVPSSEPQNLIGFVKNTADKLHLEYVPLNKDEGYKPIVESYIDQKYLIWVTSNGQEQEDVTIYEGIGGLEEQVKKAFERYGYTAKMSNKITNEEPSLNDFIEKNGNELSGLTCFHLGLKRTDDKIREVLKEILYLSEDQADNEIVDRAYEFVTNTVKTQFSKTMHEVGAYLLKTFYNDNWSRVHENKPVKDKSFNQLLDMISQGDDDSPSKAWLYNAVKVAADEKFFIEAGLEEYKKLGLSQRVKIARVKQLENKIEIAQKAVENNLTVSALNDLILSKEPKQKITTVHELLDMNVLKKHPPRRLTGMLKRVDENIASIESKMDSLKSDLKTAKENQRKLNRAIEFKQKASK